jgi:predicted O-linked N-acetylglucosamine transferase (SPINDLY family)
MPSPQPLATSLLELAARAESEDRVIEALELYREAARVEPTNAAVYINQGALLGSLGRFDEALAVCWRAAEMAPKSVPALVNLGSVLGELQRFDDAVSHYRRALALNPADARLWTDVAGTLLSAGQSQEAVRTARRGLELHPHCIELHSLLLFALNFCCALAEDLYREHERINTTLALAMHQPWRGTTERVEVASHPIRIGIVSPDLHRHSVSYFLMPFLDRYDRRGFHVTCFATGRIEDDVTAWMRAHADTWVCAAGLSDEALAARIRLERIRLLIDLSGHTTGSRPGLFARCAAPRQLEFLGYPTSSGVSAVDYRISDPRIDPPGRQAMGTTRTLRLPHSYFCYRPPSEAPVVAEPPLVRTGRPTFGSFNALPKITEITLSVWAQVLHALPQSRLVLKTQGLTNPIARSQLLDRCEAAGIAKSRVDLLAWRGGLRDHLDCYGLIDVALDTFPYNGATTTCEALWMGVPVVSLIGETHSARMGYSILAAAGHPQWAVEDVERFVATCQTLSCDPQQLAAERANLRSKLKASALMDEITYVRAMESLIVEAAHTPAHGSHSLS